MLAWTCTMSRETPSTAHHDIVVEHLRELEMRCNDLRCNDLRCDDLRVFERWQDVRMWEEILEQLTSFYGSERQNDCPVSVSSKKLICV